MSALFLMTMVFICFGLLDAVLRNFRSKKCKFKWSIDAIAHKIFKSGIAATSFEVGKLPLNGSSFPYIR